MLAVVASCKLLLPFGHEHRIAQFHVGQEGDFVELGLRFLVPETANLSSTNGPVLRGNHRTWLENIHVRVCRCLTAAFVHPVTTAGCRLH